MDQIRLATAEEVEAIKLKADLEFATAIFALPHKDGTPDLAVLRNVLELDPVFFSDKTGDQRKAYFITTLETHLRLSGLKGYYFNLLADEPTKQWRQIVTKWGAQQVSVAPELRYKKSL